MPARSKAAPKDSSAYLSFEATALRGSASVKSEAIPRSLEGKLWLSADKLRNTMNAAEPSGVRQPERSGDSPAYFLSRRTGQTANSNPKGERGGAHQFYTPSCVVRLLVTMLAHYKGRIYDPACGSGGMFVQSERFVESHGGQLDDISIYSTSPAA